jgi:hypothetical protein
VTEDADPAKLRLQKKISRLTGMRSMPLPVIPVFASVGWGGSDALAVQAENGAWVDALMA